MNEFAIRTITASVLILAGTAAWLFLPAWAVSVLIVMMLLYILRIEWPRLNPWSNDPIKACLLTLVYPIMPFVLVIILNQCMGFAGRQFLVFLYLVTAAHDTGAYIIGRLYGHHRIMPEVSPRKSWEGFFGGYAFSLVVALFLVYYTNIKISIAGLPISIFILNAAGLAGDLFESGLKRKAGLKDSGSILPGHGGLLDRFDSVLFAVVALFFILLI